MFKARAQPINKPFNVLKSKLLANAVLPLVLASGAFFSGPAFAQQTPSRINQPLLTPNVSPVMPQNGLRAECAPEGVEIELNGHVTVSRHGASPNNPDICLFETNGVKIRSFLGLFDASTPTDPGAGDIVRSVATCNRLTGVFKEGSAGAFTETLTCLGRTEIHLNGENIPVMKVHRSMRGNYNPKSGEADLYFEIKGNTVYLGALQSNISLYSDGWLERRLTKHSHKALMSEATP